MDLYPKECLRNVGSGKRFSQCYVGSVISEKEFYLAGTSSGASPAVYYRGTLQANSGVLDTSLLTPLGN